MVLRSVNRTRAPRPPYGPTAGMLQGLQLLQKGSVARVDEEFLKANGVAPGNEYKVVGALRYLGVIDQAGRPTERSRGLRTRGPAFTAALQEMVRLAYQPVLEGIDLRTASKDEVYNAFVTRADLGPEMAQKAMRFLLGLCALAGMEVSPSLAGGSRTPTAPAAQRGRRSVGGGRSRTSTAFDRAGPKSRAGDPVLLHSGPFEAATVEEPAAAATLPAFHPVPAALPQGVPLILAITPQTAELSEEELVKLFRKLFAAVRRAQTEAS